MAPLSKRKSPSSSTRYYYYVLPRPAFFSMCAAGIRIGGRGGKRNFCPLNAIDSFFLPPCLPPGRAGECLKTTFGRSSYDFVHGRYCVYLRCGFPARLGKAEWEQRDSPINRTKRGKSSLFPFAMLSSCSSFLPSWRISTPAKDARLLWLTLGTTRRHDEWEIGAGRWGERERRKKKLGKTICQKEKK